MANPSHAAVVGAGPVGCLSALSLAARGFTVSIYERRPDPRHNQIGSGSGSNEPAAAPRSINLAISARGLSALSSVEVKGGKNLAEVVLDHAIPMRARMIHTKDDGSGVKQISQAYGLNGECINSVSRTMLNDLLLDEASAHPSISIHFDCKLRNVDLNAREKDPRSEGECQLVFESFEGSAPATRFSSLIVGCDGINSIVRNTIARLTQLNFSQEYIDSSYLELRIPTKIEEGVATFALDPNHLHIWPRHSFMLIALANLDKSFTSTLFAPQAIMGRLTSRQSILDFFRREFPDALQLMGDESVVATILPRGGKGSPLSSIICDPYHYKGRAVLLGDAAHAMLPFYGQGLNCGFEDVAFLTRLLDKHGVRGDLHSPNHQPSPDSRLGGAETATDLHDRLQVGKEGEEKEENAKDPYSPLLALAFTEYTKERHPNLVAISYLATQNYREMSSRVVSPLYRLRKALDELLMKTLPKGWWLSLYSMVTLSPEIGYAEARRREARQGIIIERVLVGSAFAAVVGVGVVGRWLIESRRALASW